MNSNVEQNTTSATQQDIITGEKFTSSQTQSSSVPPYTVADLQQSLGPNITGAIGGTTPDADKEIIRDIIGTIKNDERRRLWLYQLLLVLLCPITYPFMILCCCIYFHCISGVETVAKGEIRLDGDQWSRYVQHLLADSPRKTKNATRKRLLARGYGHVLLGSEGFFLDAVSDLTYENLMVVRTEVIRAPNGIDVMLSLWFCPRAIKNDPLRFDIFLPPNMSTERVTSITNFVMLDSKCRPNVQSQQYPFQS